MFCQLNNRARALLSTLVLASTALSVQAQKLGTFEVDVVSLIRDGKTEPGTTQFTADRFGYRYLFTSRDHRDTFLMEPAKYEVQLGGACGKMAELGGRGSTDRYWVYKGKLFVFASEGCRTSFQSNPEGHIERDDPPLKATPEERRQGLQYLDRAISWSGIRWIGKGLLVFQLKTRLKQGIQTYNMTFATTFGGNGDYSDLIAYNNAGYTNRIENGRAYELDPKSIRTEHVPAWKRALERQRARELPYLLLQRDSKDLTCKFEGIADGIASVQVNLDGSTSTLWIEARTGKVISHTVRLRNQLGIIGEVQREFTVYETNQGVTLPVAWTATYNGEDSPTHHREKMQFFATRK